eukprot:TRINITY_DN16470_c0_g1_i2.p1 TRINITY_DN16470_c0_g1~~TRINITY_DN16470_c0_g1_i2.p1  ORF type:complete len:598 (-),score=127.84 TRINITY_DN16470_c0_g1_i2:72-1865(-)
MRRPSTGWEDDEDKQPPTSNNLQQYIGARKASNHFLARAIAKRLQEAAEAGDRSAGRKGKDEGPDWPEEVAEQGTGALPAREAPAAELTGVLPGAITGFDQDSSPEVEEADIRRRTSVETEIIAVQKVVSSPRLSSKPAIKPAWSSVRDQRTRSFLDRSPSRKSVRTNTNTRTNTNAPAVAAAWSGFSVLVVMVIAAQSVYLSLEGQDSGVVDVLFCSFYIIEQSLRIGAYRAEYFQDAWNIGDLGLSAVSVLDVVFSVFLFPQQPSEYETLVFFRIFRLLRLVTIVRLLRFFKELWLLAANIMTSIRTVFWAWLLMSLLIYIFALVFYRTLKPQTCLAGSDSDGSALRMYFGDLPSTMFTSFQLTTLEDWPDIADITMKRHAWLLALVLLLLVTNTYGVMHVTVAVFVNSALEAGSIRSEDVAKKAQEEHEATCKTLAQVFLEADRDSNGVLSKEEFKQVLENPSMIEKLHGAGLDKLGAAALFDILDIDGSDSLDGAEFVEGVLRSAGTAQNKDLIGVRCDVWRASITVDQDIVRTASFLERRTKELEAKLQMAHQEALPLFARASEVLAGTSRRRTSRAKKLPPIDASLPSSSR